MIFAVQAGATQRNEGRQKIKNRYEYKERNHSIYQKQTRAKESNLGLTQRFVFATNFHELTRMN
ncbi:MAG: hypothetical protein EPN85_01090 [Bacteroidetes bacterium]|nr:MAG: hypothetical protein EPN85_01090 [Bacteroidota bacterium]